MVCGDPKLIFPTFVFNHQTVIIVLESIGFWPRHVSAKVLFTIASKLQIESESSSYDRSFASFSSCF